MEAETLEERYSPEELKCLRGKVEGFREALVPAAVREAAGQKRQVTVGRIPLGECLKQLREAQEEWEKEEEEEGAQEGLLLLNLLEKGLKLIDRIELLRERKAQRKRKRKGLGPGLVAAKEGGSGGNSKTSPPREREGLITSPQEEQRPPRHLPLAPEETLPGEDGGEGSDPEKSDMEVDRAPGDDGGGQGSGDDCKEGGSECNRDNDKEASSDPHKREAGGEPGGEGEDGDCDGGGDEGSRDGPVLLNLSEESPVHWFDRFKLPREGKSERKKKPSRPPRLVAAKEDGSGGNSKASPPGEREGLILGPREEQQHFQHLPLAPEEILPEEEGREASDLQKSGMEVDRQPDHEEEDQAPGDDEGDQGNGDDSSEGGSERSSDDKEASSDPQKSEAAKADEQPGGEGEAQDCHDEEGDEEGEENSEDVCSDEDDSEYSEDSEDNSDIDDYDEDKGKSARCDALWADMDELEQKVDIMENVSQEEMDLLYEKAHCFSANSWDIEWEVESDLKRTAIHLWSAVWKTPLRAVTALQKALNRLNRFLPVELTALKKESDSLRDFLQAIQSYSTVELADHSVVHRLQKALQNFPLIQVVSAFGVSLKEGDAIKQGRDAWYSSLLCILLNMGQEKVDVLQEKVDAVQNISLKQVAILKEKIGAVQKQMGALLKVPLKEMMILLAVVNELSSALYYDSSEELNTLWTKAHDQLFTLKTRKEDALQKLHPLWKKLDALQGALCHIPIKKLEALKEKVDVLHGKVDDLQHNLWNSLEEELQLLKDKLYSLRHLSLEELEEELEEVQGTLEEMQYNLDYPLQEKVGTLQKKMGALQNKIGAWQKTNPPLKEVEEVMETERSSFSETPKAPEAGTIQTHVHGRMIADQPANMVVKMAVSSWCETTNFLANAGRSSGSIGNLRGSVSTSVPSSSAGLRKMWHGEVTLEERHCLVHKFAENISPGNDSTAAREKLVAYTKQIEEDMFELANSKMEYHYLLVRKLKAIQNKLDQNLKSSLPNQGITSNDQPVLQASWTYPGAIPPVAATTGQAQPLILHRGSQWSPTSSSSIQTSQPLMASCAPFSVNHPVQKNNIGSVSVGQVSGAALPSSLNTLGPQNSQLPCTPVTQPFNHYPLPSPSTLVGLPPTQCQLPLGTTPLPPPAPALLSIPASLSEIPPTPVAGSVPDALQVQDTLWGQTSNSSTVSSPSGASGPRAVPTSADPTAAPRCSSGSWQPAGKRPFSGVEAAEKASVALQLPETTNFNRSTTQAPQRAEEGMCAKSSEHRLAVFEPTITETEPPHKKQKMDPVERAQMATLAEALYAVHQKYVKYVNDTVTQNMEKVGDLMGRLYGPTNQASALKDTKDATALTSTLKKALALLKCFLEDS